MSRLAQSVQSAVDEMRKQKRGRHMDEFDGKSADVDAVPDSTSTDIEPDVDPVGEKIMATKKKTTTKATSKPKTPKTVAPKKTAAPKKSVEPKAEKAPKSEKTPKPPKPEKVRDASAGLKSKPKRKRLPINSLPALALLLKLLKTATGLDASEQFEADRLIARLEARIG